MRGVPADVAGSGVDVEASSPGRFGSALLSVVPVPVRARLRPVLRRIPARDNLGRRVVQNSGWLIAERLVRIGFVFLISVWTARYLGPSGFGTLAYALSLVTIVQTVGTMGMRSVVVAELAEDPKREAETTGTAVGLQLAASVISSVALLLLLWGLGGDHESMLLIAVLSLGLPLNAITVLELVFQAHLQSQHAFVARTAGLVVASLTRVGLLLLEAPLVGFAAAGAIELGLTGVAFAVIYQRTNGGLFRLRYRWGVARRLVAKSWPLFVSALSAVAYLKIDQVMLQEMRGATEVGVYAVAARLSEIWYFIPTAIGSSLLPLLIARRADPAAYHESLVRSLTVAAWLGIAMAAGITVIAEPLISILYTDAFSATVGILRVHVWSAPFVFMGAIVGRALVAENRMRVELVRNLAGAVVNIALNLVLIPPLGGMGAAIATLISHATAAYLCFLVLPQLRPHFWRMTRALAWPLRPR